MSEQPRRKRAPKMRWRSYVRDPRHAVQVAGLIASDPSLDDQQLTEAAWDRLLAGYLRSPRP